MPGKLKARRTRAKSPAFRIRNQNCRIRNQISPVIAAVRGLLGEGSKDVLLHLATGTPVSTCQKMLCGAADLNMPTLLALLQSKNLKLAGAALQAFVGSDAPLGKQAGVAQQLREARLLIRQLEGQIAAMGGGE